MRNRPSQIQQAKHPLVMAVDVARFGSDRTVIAMREGRIVSGINIFDKLDTMQVVGEVMNMLGSVAVSVIFVYETGIGAGVVDRLRELLGDGMVIGVNFGGKAHEPNKYANKRTEIWCRMNDWLKEGSVSLPNSPIIKTDLCGLQYKLNSSGQFILESKDDAKKRGVKSPDVGDSIAMTFAEYINPDYNHYADDFDDFREVDETGY